jgi:O-antigen/teichoic acid export membrane protein
MVEQTSVGHVARGVSFLWTQTLITTLFQVVAFAFIARLISTSQMGLIAILSLILGLTQLLAPLALPSAIVRFVAEQLALGQRQDGAAIFYKSTIVSIVISAVISSACFIFASSLSAAFSTRPVVFQLLAIDIFLAAGLMLNVSNALVGAQRFREYSLVTIAYMALRNALMVALLAVFRDFSWLIFAWVVSDLLYVLVMSVFVLRALGPPTFGSNLRRLLRFSLPLMPGNSANFAYSWYDRAIVLPYTSLAELGIYNATLTAFGVLSSISSGIATALYPAYAGIQTARGRSGLQDAIRVASRYVCFIATPLALGLAATAKPALSLFVGGAYESGSAALEILSLFFALTVLGNAFANIFLLLGETATASAATTASVAASIVTALALLPIFGINGAATSRGVGMLVSFILTLVLVRRHISLSFDLEALWKSFVASTAMGIVVWLTQFVFYNRLLLPAYVIVGTVAYLIGLRLLRAVRAADLQLAVEILGKRYEPLVNTIGKVLGA